MNRFFSPKLIILIAIIFFLFIGSTLFIRKQLKTKNENCDWSHYHDREIISIVINEKKLNVEVANTEVSIQKGLSEREIIPSDGMIFILNKKTQPTFWMKEMKFPLDMIWISDHNIVGVTENIPSPEPDQPLSSLPLYSPQSKQVNVVLELEALKSREWDLKPGDKVIGLCERE